jgi:hypothetical protein
VAPSGESWRLDTIASWAGILRSRALRAGGYRTLRSTFIERSNTGSAAQYLAMCGRPLHGYAFYEKDL